MALTAMHNSKLLAEHAGCGSKLSGVLDQEPEVEDGTKEFHVEAGRLLGQRGPGAKEPTIEGTYEASILMRWRGDYTISSNISSIRIQVFSNQNRHSD